MDLSIIISFLIGPIIALVLILMASRMLDKKSLARFVSAYFLGILTVIPMLIGLYFASEFDLLRNINSLRRTLLFSFVVVGFLGEFTKYLLLRFYFIPKESISKPFDGILYAVMISMGFVTVANVYFHMMMPTPFNTAAFNFSLPIANLIIGILIGFFVGFGKFRKNHIDYLTGLGVAIFFHGFYIFGILADDYLLIGLVGVITLIIAVLLSLRSLNANVDQIM
jgi:RsiW-degrading membrane proteinase PrsW (M82 family)